MDNLQRIKKVNLLALMNILVDLYDRGVNFVDIYGVVEDGQDTIGISFSKSYMDEELSENFDNFNTEQMPSKVEIKLSEKDLNDLI